MQSEQSEVEGRRHGKRNMGGLGKPWVHAVRIIGEEKREKWTRRVKGNGGEGERERGERRHRLSNSQVWVHVDRLHGIVNRSPHMAQRNDSSSFCCSTSGHASGSSSSKSHPSNIMMFVGFQRRG